MISCTVCKNNGYCPFWKSEKVNARLEHENVVPINYFTEAVALMNAGEDIAINCEKFQKVT